MKGSRVSSIDVSRLDAPMREAFAIAGGEQASVRNVLIRVRLADGTVGFGEGAPMPAFNGETQAGTRAAIRAQRPWLMGCDIEDRAGWSSRLGRALGGARAARAGLEMALLDAWCRRHRLPMRIFFGGASLRVRTDITIPIVSPAQAARAARRIIARGVTTIKVKVGRDPAEDADRVLAACSIRGRRRLILDANAGFDAAQALSLLRRLSRGGVRPDLFEQPTGPDDLAGMRDVARRGKVLVAADESLRGPEDVLRLARSKAAQVVNLKLMKSGIFGCLEIARTARAAGLGLMIGGLVESRLAMTCAAHLAAGLGGFSFIDLDTPLLFARDPMRGPRIGPGGVYELSRVRSGIGIAPKSGSVPALLNLGRNRIRASTGIPRRVP